MATDGDLARALNALATTLNDQKASTFDVERLQSIVTGATGGERVLTVHQGSPTGGFLVDDEGEQAAEVKLAGGVWQVERWRPSQSSDAYVPSAG
jgi:hypothetical protein